MATPDLEKFKPCIDAWGLPTVEARIAKRADSSLEEMQAFHDAMVPELENLMDFLNQFPPDDIPEEYLPLAYTLLSLLHVDRPVNRWGKPLLDDARDPRLFEMKSSFYDSAAPD